MSINENEDEQFRRVFHSECDIRNRCLDIINNIKNNYNYPGNYLTIDSNNDHLTNLAWRLLGGYIANNTYLSEVTINGRELNNINICTLFETLVRSTSLRILFLMNNSFDVEGVRSVVPFLENAPELITLSMSGNQNINTECFDVIVSALHNKGIWRLVFEECNITGISALETYNLPNLIILNLDGNNIGREGIVTLSNLLQKEGSSLKKLELNNTGMGDEEAEILAAALKHNTKLKELYLVRNTITEKGCRSFFKLLNDLSSIESTYNSNHTLKTINIAACVTSDLVLDSIREACNENRRGSNPNSIGRSKVIRTQLNSQNREKYCKLQGIQCPSNIFTDIEPALLPDILGLIGESHGQTELYNALVPTAPDLLSYIDRKALLADALSKIDIEYEMIKAKRIDLKKRLALLDEGDSKQPAEAEDKDKDMVLSGKKRARSQDT